MTFAIGSASAIFVALIVFLAWRKHIRLASTSAIDARSRQR